MAAAIRRIAIAAAAAVLLWRSVEVNAVAYDEAGRPRAPRVSAAAADDSAAMMAVLRGNPAEVAALVTWAQGRELAGDSAAAARAHALASRVAPSDPDALLAAAQFHVRGGRLDEGLERFDSALSQLPLSEAIRPALLQLLAAPALHARWSAIAARDTPWIGHLLRSTCGGGGDTSALARLAMARVAAGHASGSETACMIERLRRENRWEDAHQLWLNSLPAARLAEVGYVFNGGFEHDASGMGFDWKWTRASERQAGHAVAFAAAPGAAGKRALRVSYNGKRQGGAAITQYLAAAPGRYELAGMARPAGLRSVRGVHWTVQCVAPDGKPRAAAQSQPFIGTEAWQPFAFEIRIDRECVGQVLRLEPVGLGQGTVFLAGEAWFDEMRLRRLD
jgi:hypothetical protein